MSAERPVEPEAALARLRSADVRWAAAVRACGGPLSRLQEFAEAAKEEAMALRLVDEAGISWSPRPGASKAQLPYELRAESGNRDPSEPWDRLDDAYAELGRALEGDSMFVLAHSYDRVAIAAQGIARVREARSGTAGPQLAAGH